MTKMQERSIEKIRELAQELLLGENYEIKEFTINENEYFASVVVETGMKNDEGTYAQIFARERAHLFIGKRGGITYPVTTKSGKWVRRQFKGYSLLQAVCDQRDR